MAQQRHGRGGGRREAHGHLILIGIAAVVGAETMKAGKHGARVRHLRGGVLVTGGGKEAAVDGSVAAVPKRVIAAVGAAKGFYMPGDGVARQFLAQRYRQIRPATRQATDVDHVK
jgi:hypothetical protein